MFSERIEAASFIESSDGFGDKSRLTGDNGRPEVRFAESLAGSDGAGSAAGVGAEPKKDAKGLIRPSLPDATLSFSLFPSELGAAGLPRGGKGSRADSDEMVTSGYVGSEDVAAERDRVRDVGRSEARTAGRVVLSFIAANSFSSGVNVDSNVRCELNTSAGFPQTQS